MTFHELHQQAAPLLLANVWDAASARRATAAGYAALGTSSAAIASALGYADGEALPFDALCYMVGRIRSASHLPLSVDAEGGYSRDPAQMAANLATLASLGVAGVNLEDSVVVNGQRQLLDSAQFADTLQQLRALLEQQQVVLFINVRTDTWLLDIADPLGETCLRVGRYAAAGADGLFVPGLTQPDAIHAVVAASPLPLNVMCLPGLPDFASLQAMGVKRISMGNLVFEQQQARLAHTFNAILAEQGFGPVFTHAGTR